ncbi:MAG: galactokinase [Stictis urceolatum]|nr:galactokinase [Stictis urceolata]
MDEPIPVEDSLDRLYPHDALLTQAVRWDHLRKTFIHTYNTDATFVARSPGRVNIIGEHIDYSLYDVLPMGIAADVLIAISPSPASGPPTIRIANVNPGKFPSKTFSLESDGSVQIDASTHEWSNYYKAGLRGALQHLAKTRPDFKPQSLNVMVDGTVPAGGGLSSSAAFVCASALSALYAHHAEPVTKRTLVELAVVSERSVGVNSGGMDQAASVSSIRGDALHVSFSPELKASAVSFPKLDPGITFMIAQSFVAADKHVTAPVCYNLRVVEVTLAAEWVAKELAVELKKDASSLGRSLRGLQESYFASGKAPQGEKGEKERVRYMLELVDQYLPDEQGYTREQIAEKLEMEVGELEKRYMTTFPVRAERFKLRQRATHVFTEALRVHAFIELMKSPAPSSAADQEELLKKMGSLMNETQDSCRDVYECSCPELDEICTIARNAGSYGSRLTGAGWGGCSVHLVPKNKVDEVRKAWIDEYYKKKFPDVTEEKLDSAVVVTEPGHGAMIIRS